VLAHLEILHQVPAGDLVPADLLLHQSVGGQEERHQLRQVSLKVVIDV
jgi:hypothetical protein